jgi:Undecaprenyl-phosphate glucose phosphotransferase
MYFDRPIESESAARRATRVYGASAAARPRLRLRSDPTVLRGAFYVAAAVSETAAILASALAAGLAYHWLFYDPRGMAGSFVLLGCAIAFLFVTPGLVRDEYALARFTRSGPSFERAFLLWNVAFVSALVLAFLSKTSAEASRGTMILFYPLGFASICLTRLGLVRAARRFADRDGAAARRVLLVGFEEEIMRFSARYEPGALGMRIVSAAVIRSPESMRDDLALAAAAARILRPEDVFILVPWSETETIEACVDAFLRVPASIHLGPQRMLDRFSDLHIERAGPVASLRLVGRPLTAHDVALKRVVDLVGAGLGLLLLAPALVVIAALIKLESPGPALFQQRRYGFNQEPFRIFKFRSMTVTEDGLAVRQAQRGDPRITLVGAFLRRWNLDELPQLLNVLRGEMSLVGPRPHALVHDQQFERTFALYARRHNVKPGLTGWAQVNGHRGEVSDDEQIRSRVEHDLYYIDHWSLTFDCKIVALTLLSSKAYQNAR